MVNKPLHSGAGQHPYGRRRFRALPVAVRATRLVTYFPFPVPVSAARSGKNAVVSCQAHEEAP
jgi:hypothetical protein